MSTPRYADGVGLDDDAFLLLAGMWANGHLESSKLSSLALAVVNEIWNELDVSEM